MAARVDVDVLDVRVVEYEIPNRNGGTEFIRLISTVLNPVEASAAELAAVYHERGEQESVFGEIETDLRGMWRCGPRTPRRCVRRSGRCC